MCEYGRDNIKLSRAFDGSGVRMRKMLAKALRGEPIGVGVRREFACRRRPRKLTGANRSLGRV